MPSDAELQRETAEEEFSHNVDDACESYIQDRLVQHATLTEINRELELLLTVECMQQINNRDGLSPESNIHRICEQVEFALKNIGVFAGSQYKGSKQDFPNLQSITEHLAHIYIGIAVSAMKQAGVSDVDIRRVSELAISVGKNTPANKPLETPGSMRN